MLDTTIQFIIIIKIFLPKSRYSSLDNEIDATCAGLTLQLKFEKTSQSIESYIFWKKFLCFETIKLRKKF